MCVCVCLYVYFLEVSALKIIMDAITSNLIQTQEMYRNPTLFLQSTAMG